MEHTVKEQSLSRFLGTEERLFDIGLDFKPAILRPREFTSPELADGDIVNIETRFFKSTYSVTDFDSVHHLLTLENTESGTPE